MLDVLANGAAMLCSSGGSGGGSGGSGGSSGSGGGSGGGCGGGGGDSTGNLSSARVFFVASTAGGGGLEIDREKRTIEEALAGEEGTLHVMTNATLRRVVMTSPRLVKCAVVHFSCHGSLDMKVRELVERRCRDHGLSERALERACAEAIRKVLADPPPAAPVELLPEVGDVEAPVLAGVLDRETLEGMEAGLVLDPDPGDVGSRRIIPPDGLADLFRQCRSLECVVLNACTSHLLGVEFLDRIPIVRYVVSVRGRISDQAAINFSTGFYSALLSDAGDVDVEAAHAHGCAALKSYSPKARREKLVEEDGGTPQLHMRPSPPPPPAARFTFEIFAQAPDIDTKEGFVSYLQSKLRHLGLPVSDGDIEVHELSAAFNIML